MVTDLFSVQDKVVLVTGGMGQLGRQFSIALANRRAKVAILDLAAEEPQVAERFSKERFRDNFLFFNVDVTKRPPIEAALRKVKETWGIPHALINNAGLDAPPHASMEESEPFEIYSERSWDKVMEVNAKGVFLCSQIVGTQMAEAGRGSIINVCSIYGMVSPDQRIYQSQSRKGRLFLKPVAYSASKSAVLNLTRYLATYWAARNVRVNTITFGGVSNNQDKEFVKQYCARVPLGRMARGDEYNGAIIFLVSDASSYMTGANLVLDGGWTAW